jgi:hypothetical protein
MNETVGDGHVTRIVPEFSPRNPVSVTMPGTGVARLGGRA